MSTKFSKWEALRDKLPSARSIEETGLISFIDAAEDYASLSCSTRSIMKSAGLTANETADHEVKISEKLRMIPEEIGRDGDGDDLLEERESLHAGEKKSAAARIGARNRWKRLKHTVSFANHVSANLKSSNEDLLEESSKSDAGHVGAAAFEGAKTRETEVRAKGRKGMEGLLVTQDISLFQDFYVAFLKMPTFPFLLSVFIAPVALGLLFTPAYVMGMEGLTFDEGKDREHQPLCLSTPKWSCLNVLLYALSLSTTFGGSPVAAVSPFCLLIANIHTLMAQFLFVFLSGAVFARMSQPSQPIRCSKKAIIKDNDYSPIEQPQGNGKYKVLAVRTVLTGPPPCELVDAKIRLTFRIFVTLPSGSMFCSTQDLELVRSEVAYLRYGLMIRHVIDDKSPVYGHTLESLSEGDASFSLTIMGVERTSMQSIFHIEDYFVSDGDVAWDGDYLDFVVTSENGRKVLDHSRIDILKPILKVHFV